MKLPVRFSLRTLAILVTLFCVYMGTWESTKRWGVPTSRFFDTPGHDVPKNGIIDATAVAPLLIGVDELDVIDNSDLFYSRRYYLWLFGPRVKLPFESEVDPEKHLPVASFGAG